jgi:hypothetical protein
VPLVKENIYGKRGSPTGKIWHVRVRNGSE